MHIELPKAADFVLSTLEAAGFEAFVVGGSVRDIAMQKQPKDWDIATSAKPEQVMGLFQKTLPTGIAHGTVTVMAAGLAIEVTTYRTEGEYIDHRRPNSVQFVGDLECDLERRDFTVNAMAYSPTRGLVDPFGGMADIAAGVIRCVGESEKRFCEDALRMLRGVRFSCTLGFSLLEEVACSIQKNAHLLSHVSPERIRIELEKCLCSAHPQNMLLLEQLGLFAVFAPELSACFATPQHTPYHLYNVGEHTIRAVANCPDILPLRLSALLHDIGKPQMRVTDQKGVDHFYGHPKVSAQMAEAFMRRLRFDQKTIRTVTEIVLRHDEEFLPREKNLRRAYAKGTPSVFPLLLLLKKADALAQNPAAAHKNLEIAIRAQQIFEEMLQKGELLQKKHLAITGDDLAAIGIAPSKQMGEILNALYQMVTDDPSLNQKEILLRKAGELGPKGEG